MILSSACSLLSIVFNLSGLVPQTLLFLRKLSSVETTLDEQLVLDHPERKGCSQIWLAPA
jgi:hypothetical protein